MDKKWRDTHFKNKKARRSKYNNKEMYVDGIRFQSTKEGRRYCELQLAQKSQPRAVWHLRLQVDVPLRGPNGGKISTYRADFVYSRTDNPPCILDEDGKLLAFTEHAVVEDTKGVCTPEYKLKAKLFEDEYGFPITET